MTTGQLTLMHSLNITNPFPSFYSSLVIFTFVGYLGSIFLFVFATLCLACGLYYLAELVEEHTRMTKKVLRLLILISLTIQMLLWLTEGLPMVEMMIGIGSHVV
eukprot:TRINITY_DN1804_c0_g1_i3.p1 TRINITY_DN1804_c0_g1~~TRINITY_DN1804_c0_g1_i3.p1  ORF type:complete len:104 (-),score=5.53 TRINITY_DN1804_c0_g1_i3:62-373(-)